MGDELHRVSCAWHALDAVCVDARMSMSMCIQYFLCSFVDGMADGRLMPSPAARGETRRETRT